MAVLVSGFASGQRDALDHPVAGASAAEEARRALAHGMTGAFAVAAGFAVVALLLAVAALWPSPRPAADGLPAAADTSGPA